MDKDVTVRFSVLDRLIGADRSGSWEECVRHYEECVLRDLEDLFNSRRSFDPSEIESEHLRSSIYVYGLPDFASLNAESATAEAHLRSLIHEAIKTFEPRLFNIDVEVIGEIKEYLPTELKLLIRGNLRIEEDRHSVQFDTVLDVVNGKLDVSPHRTLHG